MVDPERLLYWAMADLDACSRCSLLYHVMRIPGLVRLLLTDKPHLGVPVVEQLHDRYDFTPAFEIAVPGLAPMPSTPGWQEEAWMPFDPHNPENREKTTRSLSLAEFLDWKPIWINGQLISVGHALENVGYVSGLTHAGVSHPRRPSDDELLSLRRGRVPGGRRDGVLATVTEAGRVVHRALVPLIVLLQQDGRLPEGPLPRFDYEPLETKTKNTDDSWTIRSFGREIRVVSGVYSVGDPLHPGDDVLPGARYVQFECEGHVWRVYADPAAPDPELADWPIDKFMKALGGHAVRLR